MDELEFRRRVYADPNDTDTALIDMAKQDDKHLEFWSDIKSIDKQIESALNVPVPDDLANKLIWQQSMHDFARQKQKHRWYMSLAASVAFVLGISFTLWFNQPLTNMELAALSHMKYAEIETSHAAEPVSMQLINRRLAPFSATLVGKIEDFGEIKSANYCHLDTIRSLHLIVDTPEGNMSVFILPQEEGMYIPEHFGDDNYHGESFTAENANIMVVGHKGDELEPIANTIKERLVFSI